MREVAKKKYSKSSMKQNEAISDSMQKVILSSVVDTIIRIHVVEMSLRTLPIIDKFKKNDYIKSDEYVKYIKLNSQRYLSEYDYVIWVDANIMIKSKNLLKYLASKLYSTNIVLYKHNDPNPNLRRNCAYEEAEFSQMF